MKKNDREKQVGERLKGGVGCYEVAIHEKDLSLIPRVIVSLHDLHRHASQSPNNVEKNTAVVTHFRDISFLLHECLLTVE